MPTTETLDYMGAFRYVAVWASKINANTSDMTRNPHDFHGTLGSLDFFFSEQDHVLHIWSFVSDSAGPLLGQRAEIKANLDQIAQQYPEETSGGKFDIRTLEWNRQAGPELEPCLWLRLDIYNDAIPPQEMMKKLDGFSTTGFIWNRHKLAEVQRAYWKTHPRSSSK